jgi:hypothetical protein
MGQSQSITFRHTRRRRHRQRLWYPLLQQSHISVAAAPLRLLHAWHATAA